MAKAKKQEKAADGGASASKASDAGAAKSRSTKSTPAKAEPKAETAAAGSATTKPATRPAAKKGAKSDKAASAGGTPLVPAIDTNLAAAAAASMVANRAALGKHGGAGRVENQPANAPKQESSAFKALKQGLNKPAGTGGVGGLLGTPPGQKKSNLPFGGQQQNFRNQTFGADVNRSGVPRRTSG